jgi:hypothetical protein
MTHVGRYSVFCQSARDRQLMRDDEQQSDRIAAPNSQSGTGKSNERGRVLPRISEVALQTGEQITRSFGL